MTNGILAQITSEKVVLCRRFEVRRMTGLDLYISVPETKLSFRLPAHNKVFQVDVQAITEFVN